MRHFCTIRSRFAVVGMVVLGMVSGSIVMAQEGAPPRLVRRAPSEEHSAPPAGPTGAPLEFQIFIVERAVNPADAKAEAPAAKEIMEWVKQGQATSVQRLKLATIENNQGRVQFGEQAPMVTSRSVRGGRPEGGGFGGAGGGFPVAESISYMDLGTMLTVNARCEGQRDIIAQIDLQRSSFAPSKAAEKSEGQEPMVPTTPRKLSSTLSTCVRLVAEEPVVISSQQNSQGEVSTESWVVVIASKR
jgi:hypothetical protein